MISISKGLGGNNKVIPSVDSTDGSITVKSNEWKYFDSDLSVEKWYKYTETGVYTECSESEAKGSEYLYIHVKDGIVELAEYEYAGNDGSKFKMFDLNDINGNDINEGNIKSFVKTECGPDDNYILFGVMEESGIFGMILDKPFKIKLANDSVVEASELKMSFNEISKHKSGDSDIWKCYVSSVGDDIDIYSILPCYFYAIDTLSLLYKGKFNEHAKNYGFGFLYNTSMKYRKEGKYYILSFNLWPSNKSIL